MLLNETLHGRKMSKAKDIYKPTKADLDALQVAGKKSTLFSAADRPVEPQKIDCHATMIAQHPPKTR